MYTFYSECIAISQDAASFNVKIFFYHKKIGKANALLGKNLNVEGEGYNISISMLQGTFFDNEEKILRDKILNHCLERYRTILGKKEEKES